MKTYKTKVRINWLNIIEIIIGKIVLFILATLGIIFAMGLIQWFIEEYLMEHTIARIIFYIVSIIVIGRILHKELS